MVVICAQNTARYGSQFSATSLMQNTVCNHTNFDNLGISQAQLRVGGNALYPREAFTIPAGGWDNQQFARVYQQYLECSGHYDTDTGSCLTIDDFGQLHPMFCFDLRDHEEGLFDISRTIDIRFECTVNAPNADTSVDRDGTATPLVANGLPNISGKTLYPVAAVGSYKFYAVVWSPRKMQLSAANGRMSMVF